MTIDLKNILQQTVIYMALAISITVEAANSDSTKTTVNSFKGLTNLIEDKFHQLDGIYIGGYYRNYLYYRSLSDGYQEHVNPVNRLSVGDGYREPMLLLNIGADFTPKMQFATQLFFLPDYAGPGQENNQLSLQIGVTASSKIASSFGKFKVEAGGIQWRRLSELTLFGVEGYNRWSVFDRTPWEGTGDAFERYYGLFNERTIDRSLGWGNRAFQGLYVEGERVLGQFSFQFLYGKTDNNGGVSSYLDPNFVSEFVAARVKKHFKNNHIGLNTFNNFTTSNDVNGEEIGYNILTLDYSWRFKNGFLVKGEAGIGNYHSPTFPLKWSEAITAKFVFPKKMLWVPVPLELHVFRIGENFINQNAIFFNTSIAEAQNQNASDLANSQSINPFKSPVIDMGTLTNNRQGVTLNSSANIGDNIKVAAGYGISKEIEKKTSGFSYSHRVNGLAFSRLSLFQNNIGPYRRANTIFRGYFETVEQTDVDSNGNPLNDKFFNTFEGQVKILGDVFGRKLLVHYLTFINSVSKDFSGFPHFTDKAYLRSYSNEVEVFYNLFPKLTVTGYFGYERILANEDTDLNVGNRNPVTDPATLKPRNQTGVGVGWGVDIPISNNAGLYFRHRWFTYQDKNFPDAHYQGHEATVELKVFFY